MAEKKKRGFGTITPRTANKDSVKLEEIVDLYNLTAKDNDGSWTNFRFLDSEMLPVKQHWVKIFGGKEKREITIPRLCVSFDVDNESVPLEGTDCPFCKLTQGRDASCTTSTFYLANAIVRDLQDNEPARRKEPSKKEAKTGLIEKGSKSWTPVRVVRLVQGVAKKLQQLGDRNVVKNKKKGTEQTYPCDHPKHGFDVGILYDSNAAGSDKYQIDTDRTRTPLTEEEQEYLVWDLSESLLDAIGLMSQAQADADFKKMDIVGTSTIDDEDDDDLDLGKKKVSKKKRPSFDDDDEDDDDDDDDDEDDEDDDDEPVKKKKKKKVSKKKRPSFDEDDDDEDEPVKKKKKKKKAKPSSDKVKKKKSSDDDSDEPVKKKKRKRKNVF